MTAWEFLRGLNIVCHFQTREGRKVGEASNSELRRWIQNGAFLINGARVNINDEVTFPVDSVVLFPRNRVTLY